MNQAEWLAEFAARDAANVAAQALERERISAAVSAKHESNSGFVAPVVVLEPAHELDSDSPEGVRTATSIYRAALAAGWRARMVRSYAVDPRRGPVEVITVRFSRHDEAGWAAWHRGAFDVAWYFGPTGMERLGARRMSQEAMPSSVAVEAMTVAGMLVLAREHGLAIPTKERRKDQVVAALVGHGITYATPPARVRGVLDAIEGVRINGG